VEAAEKATLLQAMPAPSSLDPPPRPPSRAPSATDPRSQTPPADGEVTHGAPGLQGGRRARSMAVGHC
jgi:hypothetical protein